MNDRGPRPSLGPLDCRLQQQLPAEYLQLLVIKPCCRTSDSSQILEPVCDFAMVSVQLCLGCLNPCSGQTKNSSQTLQHIVKPCGAFGTCW